MSARIAAPAPWPPTSTALDAETARHHRVRVTLIQLLSNATPAGWFVTDSSTCTAGTTSVPLDIAVRADAGLHRLDIPVLCVDISGCPGTVEDRDVPRRQHSLASLGVDHYWNLNTASRTLEVYVRADNDYRHAETVTHRDWLDYSIGVVDIDLPQLLEV
ncbi:hypothetical protein [uncultured Friedmanniella sp.]|uniref:hypothetical protein n=1 Tax=uncultured Friedmanniella sp. TaxID=335381 RepID=UPI0035CB2978